MNVKKQGISIRYKILALLTSVPLVTLAVYLFLALRIFESDKIAFVFESSSRISSSIGSQVKTQLNGVLANTKPIFQDFLEKHSITTFSESIFGNEFNLETLLIFEKGADGTYQQVAVLEKDSAQTEKILKDHKIELDSYFKKLEKSPRLVKAPFKDEKMFIMERVADDSTGRSTIFLIVTKASDIAEAFKSATSQKSYLISADGTVIFGPEGLTGQNIKALMSPAFLSGMSQSVSTGTESIRDNQGTDLLVSYSKVGFGDLIVLTSVGKNKALSALQMLIRKSLILFCILVSATVILGLFASSGLTQALTQLFMATQKVAEGNFNVTVKVDANDEIGSLAKNFNIMASEVSRLMQHTAEKARMESELQTAKTVQDTLFPESRAKIESLSVSGFYEPASECGGDWWHYCKVGDKVFLWIGDATGHGAPAALITSAAKSASTIIENMETSPGKALQLMNQAICEVSKGRIMMTFFLASYDTKTGELVYANASHEAPFLIRKSENPLTKKDLVFLNEVINPRLGQSKESKYEEATLKLEAGDSIFFYTDGIPDIQDHSQKAWGERKFIQALIAASKDYPSADEIVKRFSKSFQEHRKGAPLVDDVTFFVVKNEPEAPVG